VSLLTLAWSINLLSPQVLICVIWERSIKTMGEVQKVYCLVSRDLVDVRECLTGLANLHLWSEWIFIETVYNCNGEHSSFI
jgi:hypothetical protein